MTKTGTLLTIACRDSIVARDSRPFGFNQGNRMRSLAWPLPGIVSGSLRSAIGKAAGRQFSTETALALLETEIAGVFPVAEGCLYLPAPEDAVVHPNRSTLRASPKAAVTGDCDWPVTALRPVGLTTAQAPEDFKPAPAPAWWPVDRLATWLSLTGIDESFTFDRRFLHSPIEEVRTHVAIDPARGAAEEGNLFTTAALALRALPRHGSLSEQNGSGAFASISLSVRVRACDWCERTVEHLDALHPLGGERRIAHWKATAEACAGWACPTEIRSALAEHTKIRMTLASPAIFGEGWKPAWLGTDLIGAPPGSRTRLRLVGASIKRWQVVSGWSLANLPGQPRGPKPIKRIVPAGGTYFFETVDGGAKDLANLWLEPVSDEPQDRRDGFGLAVWGVW
jgi:CRISPR-associated protein Cmr3